MIFCRGTDFLLASLSYFVLAWYTLFSLAVYLGFFVVFVVVGLSRFLFPLEFDPETLLSFKPFSFLEIFLIAHRLAESFYPISVVGVFLIH